MSLLLLSSKSMPPFLFWRKRSTENGSTKREPIRPPLRVKLMNRIESDAFAENKKTSGSSVIAENLDNSINQVRILTKSHCSRSREAVEKSATPTANSEQNVVDSIKADYCNPSVEVPWEKGTVFIEGGLNVGVKHDPAVPLNAAAVTTNANNNMALSASPARAFNLATTQEYTPITSNMEILEDLRSKLMSEKMKRRMAEHTAAASLPVTATAPVTTSTNSPPEMLERDDSLVKPRKKLPSKSFIEYRRDLFKCDNDKYAEVDPPEHLVPGAKDEGIDVVHIIRRVSANASSNISVKRPDPEDSPMFLPTEDDYYPKAKVSSVPIQAKSGEDVAMHEILAAINMFVAPEYDIAVTTAPALSDTKSTVSDCLMATMDSLSRPVFEPRGHKLDSEKNSLITVDHDYPPNSPDDENESPFDVKYYQKSPVSVQELESSSVADRKLWRDDGSTEDIKTNGLSFSNQHASVDSATFVRVESHDESSPISRCRSEGNMHRGLAIGKALHDGRSVRFQFDESSVARKIEFEDKKVIDGAVGVYEDDSAIDDAEHGQREQYFTFKKDEEIRQKMSGSDGPSIATNLEEVWYDCAYLFDVVAEEFWSGLLGEDESDEVSINANTVDGNSIDCSTSDSLFVEDDDDQGIQNRRRQKMWRTYRRKLQLAKKVSDM
ncbi:hypothetical protein MPSEU_000717000 [Mayamaea pseudoterrestris]|nr:hypothetical protein MPSEU_000717000 [Mayamaea pseudoterrestris]